MANLCLFFLLTLVFASYSLLELINLNLLHIDRVLELQRLLLQEKI